MSREQKSDIIWTGSAQMTTIKPPTVEEASKHNKRTNRKPRHQLAARAPNEAHNESEILDFSPELPSTPANGAKITFCFSPELLDEARATRAIYVLSSLPGSPRRGGKCEITACFFSGACNGGLDSMRNPS